MPYISIEFSLGCVSFVDLAFVTGFKLSIGCKVQHSLSEIAEQNPKRGTITHAFHLHILNLAGYIL